MMLKLLKMTFFVHFGFYSIFSKFILQYPFFGKVHSINLVIMHILNVLFILFSANDFINLLIFIVK